MNEVTKMILEHSKRTLDDLIIDNGSGQYANSQPEIFLDLTGMYKEFLLKLNGSDFSNHEKVLLFKAIVEATALEPVVTTDFVSDIIASVDVIMTETYRMMDADVFDTLNEHSEFIDNLIRVVMNSSGTDIAKTRYVPYIWNILGTVDDVRIIRLGMVQQSIIEYTSRNCRYSLLDYLLKKEEKEIAVSYVFDVMPAFDVVMPALESLLPMELAILTFRYMVEEYILSIRSNIAFNGDDEGWADGDDTAPNADSEFLNSTYIEIEDNAERIADAFKDYMYKNYYEKTKKYNMHDIMKTICETSIYEQLFETLMFKCIFPIVRPTTLCRKFIFIPVDWYVTHTLRQFKISLRILL